MVSLKNSTLLLFNSLSWPNLLDSSRKVVVQEQLVLSSDTTSDSTSIQAIQPIQSTPSIPASQDQHLMILTKKLIKVRSLLNSVNLSNDKLSLPSIVVIGSQSSGKSSVLETIVGHEFLPKGQNMVTRRPIELTLINDPESTLDFAEFADLKLGKQYDFNQVSKILTDLNKNVDEKECVSNNVIKLSIHSANVPDLVLVDLPGYIQIASSSQPKNLKDKITDLCNHYIKSSNIILAVCSADVDFANSEALMAARRVDPNGARTIGVVTKLDLVDSELGVSLLKNSEYPLNLGYVGVVCKKSFLKKDVFQDPVYKNGDVDVGHSKLRLKLMHVLESRLAGSMTGLLEAVRSELDDAKYHLKVHYNDKRISAEGYVAQNMDILKQELKSIESSFGKTEIRNQIRSLLETRVTEICDSIYYSTDLSKLTPNSSIWTSKLNECISQMTRSGLGRTSTTLISDELMHKMTEIARNEPFIHHPVAQEKIISTSNEFIKSAFHDVVNQVENTIKPFKYDVEVSNEEWKLGIDKSCAVLDGYKKKLDLEANEIKQRLGRRLLKECNEILSRPDSKMIVAEEALKEAKIVAENTRKSGILSNRMRTLKSRQCVSRNDSCGEAVLFALTEKLAYSATMFINMELVDEFFYTVPTILERELYYGVIGADGGVGYSKENKKIKEWLEAIKRKETLESVLKTLQGLSK